MEPSYAGAPSTCRLLCEAELCVRDLSPHQGIAIASASVSRPLAFPDFTACRPTQLLNATARCWVAGKSAVGLCETAETKRTSAGSWGCPRLVPECGRSGKALALIALPQTEATRLHDGCGSWNVSTPLHARYKTPRASSSLLHSPQRPSRRISALYTHDRSRKHASYHPIAVALARIFKKQIATFARPLRSATACRAVAAFKYFDYHSMCISQSRLNTHS